MDVRFRVENIVTPELLREFAASRAAGKQGLDRAINDAMRYLLSFAWPKIEIADPSTIEQYFLLPGPSGERRSRPQSQGAIATKWRNTLAAAIVASAAKQNDKKTKAQAAAVAIAREALAAAKAAMDARKVAAAQREVSRAEGAQKRHAQRTKKISAARQSATRFYQAVAQFVRAAQRSRGYHRSGLIPAMREFRVGRAGGLGGGQRLPNPPGKGKRARGEEATPEAIMVNAARAIRQVAPRVFELAAREAATRLHEYTARNLEERLRAKGFEVR